MQGYNAFAGWTELTVVLVFILKLLDSLEDDILINLDVFGYFVIFVKYLQLGDLEKYLRELTSSNERSTSSSTYKFGRPSKCSEDHHDE